MPEWVKPMLAQLIDNPFDSDQWIFEIKWDGYRALSHIQKGKVELLSRNKLSFNHLYPEIVTELKKISQNALLDGEIVVINEQGKPSFELLKNYQNTPEGHLCYYVFDLLYYKDRDLRHEPLVERKKVLAGLIGDLNSPRIRFADHINTNGIKFFREAAKNNLEGIIGKKKQSTYQSTRSTDWVKIKTSQRQEALICGYTQPRGSREKFGALMLGVYRDGELEYIGHVGTGFSEKTLRELYSKMQPLIQQKSPFKNPPKPNQKVTWIKPVLIAEIAFAEWTKAKILRQPSFLGLRVDKKPKEVVEEKPIKLKKNLQKNDDSVTITHPEKVYWKKDHITKGEMIDYYRAVSPYLLPYLKNRPLMLHRYPQGIEGEGFYQKNMNTAPKWVQTVEIKHKEKNVNYVLIQNLETLLYVANLGSIELHPMITQFDSLDYPDFLAIDLDPLEIGFDKVILCAQEAHELLDQFGIPNYCKTSGGKGLHIYIPLHAKYTFEQINPFALLLATLLQQRLPDIVSLERMTSKRKKKVYFDYTQTGHAGHSMAAPYSLRARPHAPVSTPLKWSEVNDNLDPLDFNIHTVPKRLEKIGDLFKGVLTEKVNLSSVIKKMEKLI